MTAGAGDTAAAPLVSFVTTCKGRLAHLRQSLPALAAQPLAQVIVVDYDCPDGAGDWAASAHPAVTVVRVKDAPLFNPSRAKNAGARAARAEWLCFVDADVVLAPDFTARVGPLLKPGAFFRTGAVPRGAYGLVVCARADHAALEGYDEVMEGWGYEDVDFFFRLTLLGRAQQALPPQWVRALEHDDAERVRFYADHRMWRTNLANAFYAQVKHDLIRQLGNANLPAAARADIYRQVTGVLAGAQSPEQCRAELAVTLPPGLAEQLNPQWRIRRTLQYVLEPPGAGARGAETPPRMAAAAPEAGG